VLPWRDLLHEGPVPAGLGPAELARVRADHLGSLVGTDPDRVHAELTERDAALALAAAEPVEIALWFDHNLVNRLALLQVLDRLAELRGPRLPAVTLAEPRSFGGATADELRALDTARNAVTAEQLDYARAAWAAFRSPHPTALLPYTSDGPLAGLGPALARYLQQLPSEADGLAGTERRGLVAVAAGARDFADIYRAVTADDDPPWLGDTVLRSHLDRLRTGPRPLLQHDPAGGHRAFRRP